MYHIFHNKHHQGNTNDEERYLEKFVGTHSGTNNFRTHFDHEIHIIT